MGKEQTTEKKTMTNPTNTGLFVSYKTRGSKYSIKIIRCVDGSFSVLKSVNDRLKKVSSAHDLDSAIEYAGGMMDFERALDGHNYAVHQINRAMLA